MVLFYSIKIENNLAYFDDAEARHIQNSLRKGVGDEIYFIDGLGTLYKGQVVEQSKKKVIAEIIEAHETEKKRVANIHMAIAPTKNIDRIEWFIEKSIEIGIDKISFIQCAHSERKVVKMDRIERIVHAACKQSLNPYFPELEALQPFKQFVSNQKSSNKLIAVVGPDYTHINEVSLMNDDVCCLIGPEGGFRDEEIAYASENGFTGITLGNRRLRTETAGIVTTTLLHERLKI